MGEDKAHDLAERALDKAAEGDEAGAKGLAEDAKKLDPKAVQEVTAEVEQDRRKAEKYKDKE